MPETSSDVDPKRGTPWVWLLAMPPAANRIQAPPTSSSRLVGRLIRQLHFRDLVEPSGMVFTWPSK